MRERFRKTLVVALLSILVGAQLLETSGRWDRTINDADDEAGVIAVVLCVGAALCAAGALYARIRRAPVVSHVIPSLCLAASGSHVHIPGFVARSSPPHSLRI